jgi:hypothetical protein
MHNRPAHWTMTFAAAALVALPLTASAQTQPPPTAQAAPQADTRIDAAAAKEHMSEARDTLSQLTSLPEAARLQGDARTQVSQLISNFNDLITTQTDWRSSYAKVDANLTTLLGPESLDPAPPASAVTGAVGTSGTTPPVALDPAVRAKLVEFRTHLKAFERAAGSNAAGVMAPPGATASTANPADPTSPASPAMQPPPASVTGTSGTTPPSPTATIAADQAKAADQVNRAEVEKHLDAISTILDGSKTGTLTKAQTAELKKHVAELRQALNQSR